MGFYSIYKIIKDITRTLFGNKTAKIIIILIITHLLILFINQHNVFAVTPPNISYNQETHNFTYNNRDYKLNDDIFTMPYLLFFQDANPSSSVTWLYIFTSDEPFNVDYVSENYYQFRSVNPTTVYRFGFGLNQLSNLSNYTLSNYNKSSFGINSGPSYYISQENILFLNYNMYNYDNQQEIIFSSNAIPQYKAPTLSNTVSDLENLNFTNFIINANDFTDDIENNDGTLFMLFYNRSLSNPQTTEGLYPIKEKGFAKGSIYTDIENSTSSNMIFSYPIFKSGVFFNVGSTYEIRFAKKVYNSEYNRMVYEYFGDPIQFTISSNVTQDYINQLNQQTATTTDEDSTQELQSSINQQTQSIDNINNSITDSNVDNSSIELPTDNTQDPTQSGVDNIFQTIYNSFTSGTPQDIVFPIPFTTSKITLKPNYLYDNLQNIEWGSWIINIIQAYYWYVISRFIITDIMGKIRKIKQGNFENLQNSNIKEDML